MAKWKEKMAPDWWPINLNTSKISRVWCTLAPMIDVDMTLINYKVENAIIEAKTRVPLSIETSDDESSALCGAIVANLKRKTPKGAIHKTANNTRPLSLALDYFFKNITTIRKCYIDVNYDAVLGEGEIKAFQYPNANDEIFLKKDMKIRCTSCCIMRYENNRPLSDDAYDWMEDYDPSYDDISVRVEAMAEYSISESGTEIAKKKIQCPLSISVAMDEIFFKDECITESIPHLSKPLDSSLCYFKKTNVSRANGITMLTLNDKKIEIGKNSTCASWIVYKLFGASKAKRGKDGISGQDLYKTSEHSVEKDLPRISEDPDKQRSTVSAATKTINQKIQQAFNNPEMKALVYSDKKVRINAKYLPPKEK